MKEYNIYGLSRSGNHAIIFWIIHNFVDSITHIGNSIHIDNNRILCYINNFNTFEGQIKNNFPCDLFPVVIKSYEDIEFNKNTSIIILRDFINLLSSRYKKYQPNICLDNKYICDLIRLINIWKQHTKSPIKTILYNKWLVSKEYRDMVSTKIVGIDNNKDNTSYVSSFGEGSSFSDSSTRQNSFEYLTRYKKVKLPQYIIDYILQDQELLDINKQIFDLDIRAIL